MGFLSISVSMAYYLFTFYTAGRLAKVKIRIEPIKLFLVSVLPLVLATFRYNVGYDYGSYISGYYNAFEYSADYLLSHTKTGDPIAFELVIRFATNFNSERIFLFFLAVLSLVPGLWYILRDWGSKDYMPLIITTFLFDTFIFSFSACKQGIAINFLMLSLRYVYQRKPGKFAICVAIAFLFHSTSLAFIPVYFFLDRNKKIPAIRKLVIIAGCLLVIFNLQVVLKNVLEGRYESYSVDEVEGKNLTFWLYAFWALFFVLFSKKLIRHDPRNELLIVMAVVGAFCQILGFSNAFAKRIGNYFLFSEVFLLPQLPLCFSPKNKKIIYTGLLAYLLAIMYIGGQQTTGGMGIVPYGYKFW